MKFLLKKGCIPNKPVGDKRIRPLMVACHIKNDAKRLAIFKSLFQYEVNPELTDVYGQNSLMYTCAMNLKDELQIVLDHFVCSFYNADIHGNTLLHICAKYSSVEVMDMVLKKMFQYSMNINVRNKNNHTPLDEAILQNNISCVEKLYKVGGQCTLPGDKAKNCISSQTGFRFRAGCARSLPAVLKTKPLDKLARLRTSETQLQLPRIPTNHSLSITSSEYTDSDENESSVTTSSFKKVASFRPVPLQDSETILYKLLDVKARRVPPPSQERVPLDANWVSSTQAHLNATQEWARRKGSIRGPPEVAYTLTPGKSVLQHRSPLWKKMLSAANQYKMLLKQEPHT